MSFICEQCSEVEITPTKKELKDFVEPDGHLLCDECKKVKRGLKID